MKKDASHLFMSLMFMYVVVAAVVIVVGGGGGGYSTHFHCFTSYSC